MSAEKHQGKVRFFIQEKGYGFIVPNNGDGKEDMFFHATQVVGKNPEEGDTVEYIIGDGKKGLAAMEVQVI